MIILTITFIKERIKRLSDSVFFMGFGSGIVELYFEITLLCFYFS